MGHVVGIPLALHPSDGLSTTLYLTSVWQLSSCISLFYHALLVHPAYSNWRFYHIFHVLFVEQALLILYF